MLCHVKRNANNTTPHRPNCDFNVYFLFLYCFAKHPHIRTTIHLFFQWTFALISGFDSIEDCLSLYWTNFLIHQRLGIFTPVVPKKHIPKLHLFFEVIQKSGHFQFPTHSFLLTTKVANFCLKTTTKLHLWSIIAKISLWLNFTTHRTKFSEFPPMTT